MGLAIGGVNGCLRPPPGPSGVPSLGYGLVPFDFFKFR